MIQIQKFRIDAGPIMIPEGSEILDIQENTEGIQVWMWAIVDTEAEEKELKFRFLVTGDQIGEEEFLTLTYIKTIQRKRTGYDQHIFIQSTPPPEYEEDDNEYKFLEDENTD